MGVLMQCASEVRGQLCSQFSFHLYMGYKDGTQVTRLGWAILPIENYINFKLEKMFIFIS